VNPKHIPLLAAAIVTVALGIGAVASGVVSDDASPAPAVSAPGNPSGAPAAAVQIKDFAFGPQSTTVKVGQSVTWTNGDSFDHTVKSDTFDSGNIGENKTFNHSFDTAGTFSYFCGIHNSMTGTVVVTS
jgi:plastocyanin